MVNRPVGIGCCPKDFVDVEDRPPRSNDHYDMARNGVAVYDRRLTDAETKNFEMSFMADGPERVKVAHLVANSLKKYAQGYLEMYEEDLSHFVGTVKERLKTTAEGYPPSVGDLDKFAELVHKELKLLA